MTPAPLQPWTDMFSARRWLGEDNATSACPNVMQCRARKYANYLNISSWAPHVEVKEGTGGIQHIDR